MPGRSVRLYLIDGTAHGMRTAELGNWTGKALACPRTDLHRLGARDEVRRTGVYVLVGPDENAPTGLRIYIGESDDVWSRIKAHDKEKDFWSSVVFFVSKDANLTKAHVRWLESRLVSDVIRAARVACENGNAPPMGVLPEADVADLETFLENVRLLLPLFGLDILTPQRVPSMPAMSTAPPVEALVLEMRWKDATATCDVLDGGFVVRAGSLAMAQESSSIPSGVRVLREQLRHKNVLQPTANPGLLAFVSDFRFDSASYAAGSVAAGAVNGRKTWRVEGTALTYGDWLSSRLDEQPQHDQLSASPMADPTEG